MFIQCVGGCLSSGRVDVYPMGYWRRYLCMSDSWGGCSSSVRWMFIQCEVDVYPVGGWMFIQCGGGCLSSVGLDVYPMGFGCLSSVGVDVFPVVL